MQLSAKIEAILFWKGSLSQNKTGSILSVSVKEIETGLLSSKKPRRSRCSARHKDDEVMLATSKEVSGLIEK